MDLELEAFFQKILETGDDEFLFARAAHLDSFGDEFIIPDSTGYSGNAAAEVETAILLEQVMGLDSEGASSVASAITQDRLQDQANARKGLTKSTERCLAIEQIIAPLRKAPGFSKLAKLDQQQQDGWDSFASLRQAMLNYVEQAVAEVRA